MTDEVTLSLEAVHALSVGVLLGAGFSRPHADAIARVVVAAQRDECHSHGVFRLLGCSRWVKQGRGVPDALPLVNDHAPGIVRVDACFGFSLLAFEAGSKPLIEKARRSGIAALTINRCFHFSALWPEVESLAQAG